MQIIYTSSGFRCKEKTMGQTTGQEPGGLPGTEAKAWETLPLAPINYADFEKVDIRVGKIETAELVPKSKKLVKMTVFFGDGIGRRTILAGIADAPDFSLDLLFGHHNLFVVNLEPRKLMGIESHGMMLCATDNLGAIRPATCGTPHTPGARVR
jgi:methionyl-tRNA synthetase